MPENVTTATLVVEIQVDAGGRLWSTHQFASEADESVAARWAGGGIRHIAHALLIEAVRREAYVCALITMSRDPGLLQEYLLGSPDHQRQVEEALAERVALTLSGVIPKLTVESVQEVLHMMASQSPQKGGSSEDSSG